MSFLLAAAWLLVGAIGVAIMRHRNHDTFSWAVLFLFLGPLAVPLAVSADRHRPAEPQVPSHDGCCDVLISFDGSAEQAEAIDAALRLLGDQVTSITVATSVDLEAPTTVRGRQTRHEAEERVEAFARELSSTTRAPVDTVVLYGQATCELQRFAAEHGYELIVAGDHTTSRLDRSSGRLAHKGPASVPVLIAPAVK